MNIGWALKELDGFIGQMEQVPYSEPKAIGTHTRASSTEIAAQAQVVEKIRARALPNWRREVPASKRHVWGQHREAMIRASPELVLAFSMEALAAGKPRLRRTKDDSGNAYRSVQRGGMAVAEGISAGIRNLLAHEHDHELTEQEALEYLAALSVLARWLNRAAVELVEETA